MRVAFDIGGTFTDFVLEDTRARVLQFHKLATTAAEMHTAMMATDKSGGISNQPLPRSFTAAKISTAASP